MSRRALSALVLVAASAIAVVAVVAPRARGTEEAPAAVSAQASAADVGKDERFAKALELAELRALAQLVTEQHRATLVAGAHVSPAEVRRYYEQHRHEFAEEPRFTAHHLLVYVEGNPAFPENGRPEGEARTRAEAALAELRAGEHWENVARTYSDDEATRGRGGLLRDAQFGYFAPEVERAVKSQELGRPGGVVQSAFGYHVIEVVERVTERTPRPFEQVEKLILDRLGEDRQAQSSEAFMAPLRREVGLEILEPGRRDGPLLDERRVAAGAILAKIGELSISEADFRWFVKDALAPSQRLSADARPGARRSMLKSFLDMRVLAEKARRDGLDRRPEFAEERERLKQNLLTEFTRAECAPAERG